MSGRSAVKLAAPAGLLVLAIALALSGRSAQLDPQSAGTVKTSIRLTLISPRTAIAPQPRPTPPASRTVGRADPTQVARAFTQALLACMYGQASCARIPGTLPTYADALAGWTSGSLATPAELTARPRVVSVRVIRACRNSATVIADYVDGEGGRFQLHINVVLEHAGWQVFDVAEAPPHIPAPRPLTGGPGAC